MRGAFLPSLVFIIPRAAARWQVIFSVGVDVDSDKHATADTALKFIIAAIGAQINGQDIAGIAEQMRNANKVVENLEKEKAELTKIAMGIKGQSEKQTYGVALLQDTIIKAIHGNRAVDKQ